MEYRNYVYDHVLQNEAGSCSVTDPYLFVNSGTESACVHMYVRSHAFEVISGV